MSDQSPKPRPYVKPTVIDETTQSPRPRSAKPSETPAAKKPFVPRDPQPLRNHDGLKGLLRSMGGAPKPDKRPRRQS